MHLNACGADRPHPVTVHTVGYASMVKQITAMVNALARDDNHIQ